MTVASKPTRAGRTGNVGRKARRPSVDWEGQEQAVLIRWLYGEKMRGTAVGELYDAIYHVPNGGARHKKTASVNCCIEQALD